MELVTTASESNSFFDFLVKSHSGLRWIILALLLAAIVMAFSGRSNGKPFASNKKVYLFTMISMHIQLLIGLILYFMSPAVKIALNNFGAAMKIAPLRFAALEHLLMMLIAVALITIGYSKSKKAEDDSKKHKAIFLFYTIALIVILAAIPWPFRGWGHGWF
ncbi:MAG: hypothetical protein ACHQF2_01130 [Flavobacteriales bacterium]